jgi:hypothetical protein
MGEFMRKALAVVVSGLSIATLCTQVGAQQLPKSGSISFHTGWKDAPDGNEVSDKRVQGHGRTVGVTFNDKAQGPLHLGPANCSYAFEVSESAGVTKGYCTFGDADGDRLFTEFTGNITSAGASGTNQIRGGTGKYAGITGNGPWKCASAGRNGEFQCAQQLDYRLP